MLFFGRDALAGRRQVLGALGRQALRAAAGARLRRQSALRRGGCRRGGRSAFLDDREDLLAGHGRAGLGAGFP